MVHVVILTGAGVSAESGVPTFRDADGLWEGHRVEDVASPEGFERDPDTVQRFYDARRAALEGVEPNLAHYALAALADVDGVDLTLITQNVDDLHERAGSPAVIHMHGQLRRAWCLACGEHHPWDGPLLHRPRCPACGHRAMRPDIVWFGEMPHHIDDIYLAMQTADIFVAIGTSGLVYPAAGLVEVACRVGAHSVELNLVATAATARFDQAMQGPATEVVPAWVTALRASLSSQRAAGSADLDVGTLT